MNEIEIAIIGIATGTAIGMLIHIFQNDFLPGSDLLLPQAKAVWMSVQ